MFFEIPVQLVGNGGCLVANHLVLFCLVSKHEELQGPIVQGRILLPLIVHGKDDIGYVLIL